VDKFFNVTMMRRLVSLSRNEIPTGSANIFKPCAISNAGLEMLDSQMGTII